MKFNLFYVCQYGKNDKQALRQFYALLSNHYDDDTD